MCKQKLEKNASISKGVVLNYEGNSFLFLLGEGRVRSIRNNTLIKIQHSGTNSPGFPSAKRREERESRLFAFCPNRLLASTNRRVPSIIH